MITTTCMVTRQEQEKVEIPMDDLVVGDIVHLSAGDMIPGGRPHSGSQGSVRQSGQPDWRERTH